MSVPRQSLQQQLLACFCHIVGVMVAIFFPANAFVTYALARVLKQGSFAKQHAEQAADFNLSFTVYVLGGLLAYSILALGVDDLAQVMIPGITSAEVEALTKKIAQGALGVVTAIYLTLVVIASIKALLGRDHRYPLSLGWYRRMEKALGAKHANTL